MSNRNEIVPGMASIVICAYNNWPDLEMAIESALNQSYHPHEVIVVDNSSTDGTADMLAGRYRERIQYLRQPNRDCAGAYNTGLAATRGEYVQFLDGDDVLAPGKIATQVAVFRADPGLDIVYGDIRMFQLSAGQAGWTDVPTQTETDMLFALLAPRNHGAGINVLGTLFRRRAFGKSGDWNESLYCEDTEYWLRAAWSGCRFGHCPSLPMGFKRLRPGQKTADLKSLNDGFEAALEKSLEFVTREPYRSMIAAKLAQSKFHAAISRSGMTIAESLGKLAAARRTSPDTVSGLAIALGATAVILPGGSILARARLMRPLRRVFARLAGYPVPQ